MQDIQGVTRLLTLIIMAHPSITREEISTTYMNRHDMATAAGWTEAIMAVAPPLAKNSIGIAGGVDIRLTEDVQSRSCA